MNLIQKKHSFQDLDELYRLSEECDKEVFAEQRSNILLTAGNHYSRKNERIFRQIRESKDLTDTQKIKLTKNHTQNIVRQYVTAISSQAPWVSPKPQNEKELQDQKSAELNKAIWETAKDRNHLDERVDRWCHDMVTVGEVATKIFWDKNEGYIKAYEPLMDEMGQPVPELDDQGQVMMDEMGQPILKPGAPVFSGDFVFETIYGFNLLRDPCTEEMRKSVYLCIRKMVPTDLVKIRYPDMANSISTSSDQTFTIFDSMKGDYRTADNEVFIREFYFRPCQIYPKGYYYIISPEKILEEGELPGGIFPICFEPYETFQTAPRGRSPIRHARPFQIEINRAASKAAEHQVTLGDDKILLQYGSKVSSGVSLPGVRTAYYTGVAPIVMPGRDGSQYYGYMDKQIDEMYMVMGLQDLWSEKANGAIDVYAVLYRSGSQKLKFSQPVKSFERFLKSVCETYLALAKIHLPDDAVIYSVGKKEQVNIGEFRNTQPLCYQIVVEAVSEDIDTKMGRQLSLAHALQYVGPQLDKEDIGKLIRAMPYANIEESLSDLTIDYDNATNEILALDRGEAALIHPADNHQYHIRRLINRMRQSDFKHLDPQIQAFYEQALKQHEQYEVMQLQKIRASQADFIPTTGFLVSCDFYQAKPGEPDKTQRVRLPSSSIQWLIDRLAQQGATTDQLEMMNQQALSDIASQLQNQPTEGTMNGNGIPDNGSDGNPGNPGSEYPDLNYV